MNQELKLLIDILWVAFLGCMAFVLLVCGVMYLIEGAIVMGATAAFLSMFIGTQGYLYVRDRGYL